MIDLSRLAPHDLICAYLSCNDDERLDAYEDEIASRNLIDEVVKIYVEEF